MSKPASFAELYEERFDYVRALVCRAGLKDDEDVAQELLIMFYEKGYFDKFEENREFDVGGGRMRKSNFLGYFSGIIMNYMRQHRDRQMTRAIKEPIHLDAAIEADGDLWIEILSPTEDSKFEKIEFRQRVQDAYNYLKELPIRGKRDLAKLFSMLVEQVVQDGRSNLRKIADEFEVSPTAISFMMEDLRQALDSYGFRIA